MATKALFGSDIVALQTRRFREIFEHVKERRADVGVIPIENALAGSVHENYDLLAEFDLEIIGEYYCPVQLHLMTVRSPDGKKPELDSISQAVSHPKALEQCSQFLELHPSISPVVFSDTAGAAEMVRDKKDSHTAAIASEEAAQAYGLEIVARSIQNHAANSTRFVAISLHNAAPGTPNKCSLLFTLPHRPGSLHTVLGTIAGAGMNVTKIESRPIMGRPFEYTFHVDIECEQERSGDLIRLTRALAFDTAEYRVLGMYVAADSAY
jgi:prephenate dehydratase